MLLADRVEFAGGPYAAIRNAGRVRCVGRKHRTYSVRRIVSGVLRPGARRVVHCISCMAGRGRHCDCGKHHWQCMRVHLMVQCFTTF